VDQNQAWFFFQSCFHQDIHHMFVAGNDIGIEFLLQKLQVPEIYKPAGVGEEKLHKFYEKGLQEFLEQAIVICMVLSIFKFLRLYSLFLVYNGPELNSSAAAGSDRKRPDLTSSQIQPFCCCLPYRQFPDSALALSKTAFSFFHCGWETLWIMWTTLLITEKIGLRHGDNFVGFKKLVIRC